MATPSTPAQRVICIGDVHGNFDHLMALWQALRKHLGDDLDRTTVVFLGDYCDRGPNTRAVLDWLIALKALREHPGMAPVHFICGNHDFGMAAFLGCLPISGPPPLDLESTRDPAFTSGFWPYPVEGGMHYMGRRWANMTTYQCASTFKSYGVELEAKVKASAYAPAAGHQMTQRMHANLLAAVPASHRRFLSELQWVHEQPVAWPPGTLVCVHAGLQEGGSADEQLAALRARDLAAPALHDRGDKGRNPAFCGRTDVLPLPPELQGRAMLVSGHHGFADLAHGHADRIVCDRSGGTPKDDRPLEAVLLPDRTVVGSDGSVTTLLDRSLQGGS